MTLVINLDSYKKEIEGITFEFKPLTQAAMAKFASLSQKNAKPGDLENQDWTKYITDVEFQKLFAEIIPIHCEIKKGGFEIQENGALRDGTLEDIMTLDNASFFRIKMALITELIKGSNLSLEEANSTKK